MVPSAAPYSVTWNAERQVPQEARSSSGLFLCPGFSALVASGRRRSILISLIHEIDNLRSLCGEVDRRYTFAHNLPN